MSPSAARIVALGVLVALWGSGTSGAQTAAPTLGVLVDQVQALFPKVDGEVIEVQNGTVTLALGSRDGLVAGVELALYRQGRELRHPKTGEVLGRTEPQMGRLAVQQVFEAYSTGTVSPGSEVQPGDRARISAGKIKLSVVPFVETGVRDALADAAIHEVMDALNRTGRFQIGLGDAIGVWLTQQGIKRDDVLAGKGVDSIAERFKVDNLLVIAFSRVQSKPYMDVRLFSLPGASSRLSTALFVPASIRPVAKGDYSAGGRRDSQTPNPQRSFLARLLYGELDAGTYSSGESAIPLKEVATFPFLVQSMHATRVSLRNGKLVSEGRVRVPGNFRATGAVYSNIAGKGVRALAFIDEFNRLRIAIDTEDTFLSAAPVGTGMAKLGVESQVERGGRTYVYYPEPMPLSVDLDGDGIEEVIVPQNQIPGRLAVVYKGPAGYRFQTVNSGFEGTVIALGAVPGDVTPTLVAAVVRYTNFRNTEGETQIIMTTSE